MLRILDNDLQIGSPIAFDLRSMAVPVLNTTATKDLHDEYHLYLYQTMC